MASPCSRSPHRTYGGPFAIAAIFVLALCALLACGAPVQAARPAIPQGVVPPKEQKVYVVRTDSMDMHSCGEISCPVIGRAERGERMTILETVGNWIRVRGMTSGKEGWINTKPFKAMPRKAVVTARALNLRTCPDLSCAVVTVLPKGQKLVVLEIQGGWTRVRLDFSEITGWVFNKYIRYY